MQLSCVIAVPGGSLKVNSSMLSRRAVLAGGAAVGVCAAAPVLAHEAAPFQMPEEFLPTVVRLDADFSPGEIHVLPDQFRLYWTLLKGEAIRFTVGVGRPGLYHAGRFTVGLKREWPRWKPTSEMIERNPDAYAKYADGMPGGPDNPLGARALYLFDETGQDTMLRIHGTNDPRTIGTAVSNGCARLTNEDITFWYTAVEIGTPVFLHPQNVERTGAPLDAAVPAESDGIGRVPRELMPGEVIRAVSSLPRWGR